MVITQHIDFAKVEDLRRAMLLTVGNMADYFGVSRETWYNWQRGKPPRPKMLAHCRSKIRLLLWALEQGWPTPEVISADQKDRYSKLLALVETAG